MGHPAPAMPPTVVMMYPKRVAEPELRFECLLLEQPEGVAKKRSTTLLVSATVHAILIALIILIPLLTYSALPAAGEGTRAFFVAPPEAAPPPPPPPPPAPAARVAKAAAPVPVPQDAKFTAPVEVPDAVLPEASLGLEAGVEGGVPGGVEGGVPGGVLGGIVGGIPMPTATPPPIVKTVRVGGQIKAPKQLRVVRPAYPDLAVQARLAALVILEALVGTDGNVKTVSVLRGAPLFDDAAMAAVKQWRYQPLLLNGVPTEFILTLTVKFNLNDADSK